VRLEIILTYLLTRRSDKFDWQSEMPVGNNRIFRRCCVVSLVCVLLVVYFVLANLSRVCFLLCVEHDFVLLIIEAICLH